MEDITERPFFALEEQLARQKGILANTNLVRKLPDKGAKLRESVGKLEAELERRRKELEETSKQGRSAGVPDVAQLEWALRTTGLSSSAESSVQPEKSGDKLAGDLDSDDDAEVDKEGDKQSEESTLKLLATSQITQRQEKPVIACGVERIKKESKRCSPVIEVKPDPYLLKLVEKDVHKGHQEKFLPAKSLKKKTPGSTSPALSATSEGSAASGGSGQKNKYDEVLLPPPQSSFDGVKLLSMEETIKISCDKYKQAEVMKVKAPPKKTYAYDKLKDQGLLGSYTVAMQTSRPVRPDVEADEDLDESDLSHDSISEDSEESDMENDKEKSKSVNKSSAKTSKDLSSILNKSLKLS